MIIDFHIQNIVRKYRLYRKITDISSFWFNCFFFQKYIICSDSKEDSDFLTVIQEPDNIQRLINQSFDSTYIRDIHVFDASLQPSDLGICINKVHCIGYRINQSQSS